jgi:GTP pyrophosphokinase
MSDNQTIELTERFEEALVYANRLHVKQKRKGTGVPYVAHLLSVTALVLEQGGDEDEAIAALLHDAIEDQGGVATREEIRKRFGDKVTEIVVSCSDTDIFPKPPWKERKEKHIAHIRTAPMEVIRVAIADKLHNARCVLQEFRLSGHDTWLRFRGGREGTLWYYREMINAFRAVSNNSMIDELDRVVSELEQLAASTP